MARLFSLFLSIALDPESQDRATRAAGKRVCFDWYVARARHLLSDSVIKQITISPRRVRAVTEVIITNSVLIS